MTDTIDITPTETSGDIISEVVENTPSKEPSDDIVGRMGINLDETTDEEESEGEDSQDESSDEVEEIAPEVDAKAKLLEFLVDGKSVKIPETAPIEVKVDGKVEKISIAELKKNYSGKVVYDKKFQELDVEKREFADTLKTVDSKLNDIFRTIKKDPEEGLRKLYKMAKMEEGADEAIAKIKADIEEMQTLSDDELELRKERRRLAAEREALEEDRSKTTISKQEKEIGEYADTLMSQYKVSAQEFAVTAKVIKDHYGKEKLDKMTANELVEETVRLVLVDRDNQLLDTEIAKVEASKKGDSAFKQEVIKIMSAAELDFNSDNILFVARGLLGKSEPENSIKAAKKTTLGASSKNITAETEGEEEDDLGKLVNGFLY
jgi:hypothetical protein